MRWGSRTLKRNGTFPRIGTLRATAIRQLSPTGNPALVGVTRDVDRTFLRSQDTYV